MKKKLENNDIMQTIERMHREARLHRMGVDESFMQEMLKGVDDKCRAAARRHQQHVRIRRYSVKRYHAEYVCRAAVFFAERNAHGHSNAEIQEFVYAVIRYCRYVVRVFF